MTNTDKPGVNGWMDIASAPRDGTRIILYFPYEGAILGQWLGGSPAYQCVKQWGLQGIGPTKNKPTHWQHLPPPPEGDERI